MTDETNGTNGAEPGAQDEPQSPDALAQAAAEVAAAFGDAPEEETASAEDIPSIEVPEVPMAPPVAPEVPATPPPAPPAAPVASPSGPTVINDRFEVGELTGRTAMLETYRGRDRVLGTAVDVRFLSSQLAADEVFAQRFVSEAQAAMGIDHPNVVKILDAGDINGMRYLVMEHVEGQTLQQLIRREGPMEAERAASIASSMCGALQAAHDRGIVHRDINPGVVILTADDQIKVADFGVARVESPQTVAQTRAIMGTAAYLSPEQAQGEQADARSDVYSTGVVLYEMLAGKPPFTAESPVAVAYMHVRDTPKPLSEVTPGTPQRIADAVMAALAKKPSERFQTAAEFQAALAPAAAPTEQHKSGRLEPETMVFGPAPGADRGGLSTRTKVVIGVVAAFLAIAALYVFLLMPRNVRVPTVLNMSQAQAEQVLGDAGLGVKVVQQQSNEVPPGVVFGQAPAAAQVVPKGTEVIVRVATAPANIVVPNVVGLTQTDAEAQLQQAGLTLGTVTQEASDTTAAGTVLSQDPPAGTQLAAAQAINLTVAQTGVPATVPNLTCNTADRAATILDEAGLQMTVAGVETDPNFSNICPQDGRSRITQTDPAPGTQLAAGAVVQVWVTVPLPSPAPTSAVPTPASPFPSPVDPSATTSPLP